MTNSLALTSLNQTMTSREIAELTGKRHDNVLRDIRTMIERLSADSDLSWHCETITYIDEQGKPREQYQLDKDTTLTLVTGYDPIPRMKIIKRWQELESHVANTPAMPAMPADYPSALRALADQVEYSAQLEHKIATDAPKVQFHDQVVATEALVDIDQVRSLLQMQTGQSFTYAEFLEFLRWHGIIHKVNIMANVGPLRFKPRKKYIGKRGWFVPQYNINGGVEWQMRTSAIVGLVHLIERGRNETVLRGEK